MSTYTALEIEIVRWAESRKIVQNSTPLAQSRKTLEEVGEQIEAAAKMAILAELLEAYPELEEMQGFNKICERVAGEYADAVGDVATTLIVGCATADLSLTECLEAAYNEIKDRKGYLRPDGVFVKEV